MPTSQPSPEEVLLVEKARQDPEAFAELYRKHVQRVYRYHIARTNCVEDAQDLTAQTFMAALERLSSYQGRGSFCAWLLGIARNKVALHYRSRKPVVPLEDSEALHDPAPLPESAAGQRMQLAQVSRALKLLSPERMEALILRYFTGLSLAETGRLMGKSEAAVKMQISRGLQDLRERLGTYLQEDVL